MASTYISSFFTKNDGAGLSSAADKKTLNNNDDILFSSNSPYVTEQLEAVAHAAKNPQPIRSTNMWAAAKKPDYDEQKESFFVGRYRQQHLENAGVMHTKNVGSEAYSVPSVNLNVGMK